MVTMPEELIVVLTGWHTVPVAPTSAGGKPNVAGKSVMIRDPETIVRGELSFRQTYENLMHNLRASVCVGQRSPPFRVYKVNGRVKIHENDEIAAQLDERVRSGHGMEFMTGGGKNGCRLFCLRRSL